jgi:hypothetical protein
MVNQRKIHALPPSSPHLCMSLQYDPNQPNRTDLKRVPALGCFGALSIVEQRKKTKKIKIKEIKNKNKITVKTNNETHN